MLIVVGGGKAEGDKSLRWQQTLTHKSRPELNLVFLKAVGEGEVSKCKRHYHWGRERENPGYYVTRSSGH